MRMMVSLALTCMVVAGRAEAGIFTDDLSRCLVQAAGPADRSALMRWLFGAYAASDAAKDFATITAAQHTALNREGATLFRRLLLKDCRVQASAALKNEGPISIQQSFEILGQIAGRGIMSDPKVAAQMNEFIEMAGPADIAALGGEEVNPKPK